MKSNTTKAVIVVPCYNEADRLPVDMFHQYAQTQDNVRFLMVNDGSADGTLDLLAQMQLRDPQHIDYLDLGTNQGKAEAVRQGFCHVLSDPPEFVGFWDADLSTPLPPIDDFCTTLDRHARIHLVIGTRVPLLGRQIQRRRIRHLLGRVFARTASTALRLNVYDTQCGAKLFRVTPDLVAVFAEPFLSRWIFDVEIIARLRQLRQARGASDLASAIYEYPLDLWREVGGSRLKQQDFVRAIYELTRIYGRHLRPGARPYLGLAPHSTMQSSSKRAA